MKEHYDSPEEFAGDAVKAAKAGWVNGTYSVNGALVGIKAHGKWVQRIQANTLIDSGDFRTQSAMRDFIVAHIGH